VISGRPMVRSWDALVASRRIAPPPPPWPAPSVPQRAAGHEETPKGARAILAAVRPPWRARATFSRGTPPDRYGRPAAAEVDCLVIRATGPDGSRAWAAYWDGKFKAAAHARSGTVETLGATAFKDLVRGLHDAG
jgi:hypothetical protein